ncbi:ribosomal-processing cysteine protease Prp [Lacticaseibacillus saniviri]
MIKVRMLMKDSNHPVGYKISGHAGFAIKGTDIVCAAVSALVITMTSELFDAEVEDSGDAFEVSEIANTEHNMALSMALYRGLKLIATQYPKNVVFEKQFVG